MIVQTKKLFPRSVICVFFLFVTARGFAQTDTLEIAKKLRDSGKIQQAYKLLGSYYLIHSHDLNAVWLYAQTAYWVKDIKTSEYLYTQAITENPGNYYLKLDYALMLTQTGETEKARPLLDTYLQYDSANVKALTAIAQSEYWNGNYNTALQVIDNALRYNKGNAEAEKLKYEILTAISPSVNINTGYSNDSQPLQQMTISTEVSVPYSALINVSLKAATPFFIHDGSSSNGLWLQAGNQFNFNKEKVSASIAAGYFLYPYKNGNTVTGKIDIAKTFGKYFNASVQGSYSPYTSTLASLDTAITSANAGISLSWNKQKSFTGNISYQASFFKDENRLDNISAWFLSPPLVLNKLQLKAGYHVSYSTSLFNLFMPDENKIGDGVSSANIPGIYSPYFTPYKQQAHSVIASLSFQPTSKINIGINGGYALYGSVMNPYFFNNGNVSGTNDYIKDYAKENFSPAHINASASLKLNDKMLVNAAYSWQRTFFFSGNYASLGLKINFIHDEK